MSLSVVNLSINKADAALISALSFTVNKGQVLTMMGPSGCGKSTLLSAIAGHLSTQFTLQGDIQLNGKSLLAVEPNQRRIGILFQDDLLFPHLNVWQNLAFGLPKSIKGNQRQQVALETLEQIELSQLAEHMPDQISGGQRARISLMRTLLSQPQAILLDEPFSKLDKALRTTFREFVFKQIEQQNIPALMVSHDIDDVPTNGEVLDWPWHKETKHA